MNQNQLLTRLSLKYTLESGIRLKQRQTFISDKLLIDNLDLIQEDLKEVQVLDNIQFLNTDHPYKYTIKGRKTPHIVSNIRFGLFLDKSKYNILVTKCDKGIMNLLAYELA